MIYLAVSLQYRNLTDGLLPRLCIASRGKNLARAHNSNNIESWSTNSVHTQNEFEAAYIRPVFLSFGSQSERSKDYRVKLG